jgi:adenylylsulfate kinase-like enzyme
VPGVAETACVWLTGRAGAGKSTIARAVGEQLRRRGRAVVEIDDEDAQAHLRADDPVGAVAWLARTLVGSGVVVVVALDTPERERRERVRTEVPGFVEVFVDGGGTRSDPAYEEPFAPELRVPTRDRDAAASAAQVVSWLEDAGIVPHDPPHPSD